MEHILEVVVHQVLVVQVAQVVHQELLAVVAHLVVVAQVVHQELQQLLVLLVWMGHILEVVEQAGLGAQAVHQVLLVHRVRLAQMAQQVQLVHLD
jgi:hypothetical protein